jgi:two-component system response regulator YesN
MKNQSLIVERFWLDIISHRVMAHPTAIREYADMRNIPITDDMEFLPVLLSVQRWHRDLTGRDEKILEYALMKSAEEMILADHHNGMFFYLDDGRFIGIIAGNKGDQWDLESLTAASHRYISSCNQYFYCDLSCYWGMPVQPHMMSSMVEKLRTQDNNNVAFFNQVYLYCEDGNMHQQVQLPDLDIWTNLLKTEDRNEIIVSVEKLFDRLTSSGHLNADLLHKIQQDYLQALYSYLNQKGIQAHQLFGDEMSKRVAAAANRSVADMLSWVKYSVERAINQSEVVDKAFTLVETVKQYIARNIDRDLSRELIASIAYLNPDHLSRIFKKHTGYAISEYVLMERVKLAKKLLVTTDIPIGAIATSVGYSNFSHFARMFKKYAEMGPSEYRQKYMEGVKINASFHKTIDQ